jgi:hypothetical protein
MTGFLKILIWLAIVSYLVMSGLHARDRRAGITVGSLRIVVTDTTRVVTAEKITGWLKSSGIDPIGRRLDSAGECDIERSLSSRPEIRRVSVWTDLGGVLTVRVEPRTPLLRVRTSGGYRFWYTSDGYIMPDRGDYGAHVSVVTGSVAWPFGVDTGGDYAAIRASDRRDFRERFMALSLERQTLQDRLSATRAEIRTVRGSTPGRLRSRSYKQLFAQRKATRLAELETARAEIVPRLSALDRMEASLREKEKKSFESHRFLSKLANFVRFIERDHFWGSQIVQINVTNGARGASGARGAGGANDIGGTGVAGSAANGVENWREPQLELIPRAGDHLILLGELDGTEEARLGNLRTFYERAMWQEGWETYRLINIKYANQIVCTK